MRVLLLYLNLIVVLFMDHFYGNITVILENAVHNGTNVLAESILIHITHIDSYYAL